MTELTVVLIPTEVWNIYHARLFADNSVCPSCRSKKNLYADHPKHDHDVCTREVVCTNCHISWVEEYGLDEVRQTP
jgi:hypothetical protein